LKNTNTLAASISLVLILLLSSATLAHQSTECGDSDKLTNAVKELGGSYDDGQKGRVTLLEAAAKSRKCKKQIVSLIMKAMDKPDLDLSRDQASYYLWREGSTLLGELKATEALDLLISHIGINDGEWSVTMVHQPALGGIIEMGSIAIPKLSVLLRSPDRASRHDAVYCLSFIGGASALQALKQALPSETDSCTKRFLQVSIRGLDNQKKILKDNGEWLSAFLCM